MHKRWGFHLKEKGMVSKDTKIQSAQSNRLWEQNTKILPQFKWYAEEMLMEDSEVEVRASERITHLTEGN